MCTNDLNPADRQAAEEDAGFSLLVTFDGVNFVATVYNDTTGWPPEKVHRLVKQIFSASESDQTAGAVKSAPSNNAE